MLHKCIHYISHDQQGNIRKDRGQNEMRNDPKRDKIPLKTLKGYPWVIVSLKLNEITIISRISLKSLQKVTN